MMTGSQKKTVPRLAIALVLVLTACSSNCCDARKDRNQPHPHRGLLKSYNPGPFEDIKLSQKEESKLAEGQPVMKQTLPDKDDPNQAGGALCIQDVNANKAAVWKQILDFDDYENKVPKVNNCKNYFKAKNKDGTSTIKTKMVIGVMPGYSYENYYDHTFHENRDSLTWSLDYDKTSDFDDVAGHWHVEDHPTKPGETRVFYACDIKMKGHVPKPIISYISKSALLKATAWVKRESELSPDAHVSSEFAASEAAPAEAPPSKKRRFAFGRKTPDAQLSSDFATSEAAHEEAPSKKRRFAFGRN